LTKFPREQRQERKKKQNAVYWCVSGGAAGLLDPAAPPVMKEKGTEEKNKQIWKKSKAT
jgi:hypothetical protein